MTIKYTGEKISAGFTMRGANTDPNRPPEPPKKDTGPQLYRDPKYPTMVQNGLSGGGSSGGGGGNKPPTGGGHGSGFGGGNRPHDFQGYEKFTILQEWTFGKVNDTPFAVKSSAGLRGYIKAEGTYSVSDEGKRSLEYGSSKTTGHGDGRLHHHGTHWQEDNGKKHGFVDGGDPPRTGILKNLIK